LIIAIVQFDTLWPAFWIFIILSTLQMVLGNFIEPKIMGKGLGLSPLVILFSLFFWGWLWGLPGMILAVPIAAIIKIVTSNIPALEFISVLIGRE
jgi:predicted PurR-regulated permease PerM